jgi:hypothetical protein
MNGHKIHNCIEEPDTYPKSGVLNLLPTDKLCAARIYSFVAAYCVTLYDENQSAYLILANLSRQCSHYLAVIITVSLFSLTKNVKSRTRTRLTDEHLEDWMQIAT